MAEPAAEPAADPAPANPVMTTVLGLGARGRIRSRTSRRSKRTPLDRGAALAQAPMDTDLPMRASGIDGTAPSHAGVTNWSAESGGDSGAPPRAGCNVRLGQGAHQPRPVDADGCDDELAVQQCPAHA